MKIRAFLRKKYETNKKIHTLWIYYFLKIAFICVGKYKSTKKEIITAIETFEDDNIKRKEYRKLFRKYLIIRYIYFLRANEYYLYGIKDKTYEEIDTFIPRRHTKKYYAIINDKRFRKVFDKKNLTYQIFSKYYKRDFICVRNKQDLTQFKKFIKDKEKFILKPLQGHSGHGIKIININDYSSVKKLFNKTLKKAPYVAEELIIQSPKLGCFHPESVNTIRVVTFQYKNNVSILWAFLRTGQGENSVDNMGSNGMGALIDSSTGVIISDGIDWKGTKIQEHPDSKITFKGFKIPEWDKVLQMVTELAGEITEMHCVGWDLALTDKGWVLVEGNARPQCVTVQTITKKGYRSYYDTMCTLVRKEKSELNEIYEGKREL